MTNGHSLIRQVRHLHKISTERPLTGNNGVSPRRGNAVTALAVWWGPFHERFFHHYSNSMELSLCSHSSCSEVIAMNFCTWHDVRTVVACKNCSDVIHNNSRSCTSSKFLSNLNYDGKIVSEMRTWYQWLFAPTHVSLCISLYMCMYIYTHIYIYIYNEMNCDLGHPPTGGTLHGKYLKNNKIISKDSTLMFERRHWRLIQISLSWYHAGYAYFSMWNIYIWLLKIASNM